MADFLTLPLELRNIIYGHVAGNIKVRFVHGNLDKTFKRSRKVSLLICSKQVHDEFKPFFYKIARLDVTQLVKARDGSFFQSFIDPTLLRHVKLSNSAFTPKNAMKLLKSMVNLTSLTCYDVPGAFYIENGHPECECCGHYAIDIGEVESVVKEKQSLLVGGCVCEPDLSEDCCADNTFRKVVAVWEYLDQPYKLVVETDIVDTWEGVEVAVSQFDLLSPHIWQLTMNRLDVST